MQQFRSGELLIERHQPDPALIRLYWKGRSAARRPEEALNPFLEEQLTQAKRSTARIEMRFEQLEFFNSSTVACLVHFLHRARTAGVQLSFTYLPTVRWQRLSFEALRVFEQIDHLVHVIPLNAA